MGRLPQIGTAWITASSTLANGPFPISPQSRWDLLTYGLKTISARIASTATAAP